MVDGCGIEIVANVSKDYPLAIYPLLEGWITVDDIVFPINKNQLLLLLEDI